MNRFFLTVCFLLMTTLSGFAASNTTDMSVSVTVSPSCTISTGNYDPATANSAAALNGTLSPACTSVAPAAITLSQRSNANASSTTLTAFKGGQNVPAGSTSDTVVVTVTF